ncbi:MAG: hypothetical protein WBG42_08035 [Cryomorphaceae bacterium]
MKQLALTLSILSISLTGFSQTKVIAHKSHSGSDENFQLALKSDNFNPLQSNFGQAPDRYVINAQLDSVIYIDAQQAILVTSYVDPNNRESSEKELKSNWKPDRETVYKHPLFSQQHSLDSIKMVLKRDYHFQNDIENVVFVGYDNGEQSTKENQFTPASTFSPKGNAPHYFIGLLILVGIGLTIRSRSITTARA